VEVVVPQAQGVPLLGELPPDVHVRVDPEPADSDVEFWVPPFLRPAPDVLARMPQLRVVQLLTAGADAWIGRVPQPVTLCTARGVHTSSTSEWAVAAVLAYLREFPGFARAQARGEWDQHTTDELAGKHVLIVGAGEIGEAIAARLAPFEVRLTRVARQARADVHGIDELPGLLPAADVVIIIVPLTAATTRLVDATFLGAMHDGALLVNAARGPVVDTEALIAELATGRIGAALDVIDPEPLPAGHPLWSMPNVLLTPHVAGSVAGLVRRGYALVREQLGRYIAGQPLRNVVSGDY
jgi:phosphoglycerate dehydrogenase-like enzyme